MEEIGKVLIYIGIFITLTGILLLLVSKFGTNLPIGKLPGDIYIKRDNFVFYFPLGTSLLISLILSLLSFLFFFLTARK